MEAVLKIAGDKGHGGVKLVALVLRLWPLFSLSLRSPSPSCLSDNIEARPRDESPPYFGGIVQLQRIALTSKWNAQSQLAALRAV
jgi:hypothetical protein